MAAVTDTPGSLVIDVPPELRQRISAAAATRNLSVPSYVRELLEREVPAAEEERPPGRPVTREMVERFRELRESVMQGRTFELDSATLIHEAHQECAEELERCRE
jgi:predicted HicB family RNase H-like nuclease